MTTITSTLKSLPKPTIYPNLASVGLTQTTLNERLQKVITAMQQHHYDALVIYADKEHGGNFEYLTGFIPRFEEALLIVYPQGDSELILGNENLKMARYARISNSAIRAPWFSLPNQPMEIDVSFQQLLQQTRLSQAQQIGIVGWKLFTSTQEDNSQLYDIPHYILHSLQKALKTQTQFSNATKLFIDPASSVRTINNANEIAHYEYGANLASSALLTALDAIALGKTEKQIAQQLTVDGQPNTVITIAATGERFAEANLYPSNKTITLGDKFSATVAYKGGLTCRAAYIAHNEQDLAPEVRDYLSVVAQPYFHTVAHWLEQIHIGMTGDALYQQIEHIYPKAQFGWHLNPGHLVADEEWLSSPIFAGSTAILRSGMILQIDIIPSHPDYAGVSIEDTVALANSALQQRIAEHYPELWQRIQTRRDYIKQQLHIDIHQDVLPLSNTVGYLRPYLLNQQLALCKEK